MASASSKPVTKKDVEEVVIDASHTILTGVSLLLKKFARKDDLEKLATKDDLKREISFVRDDIKGKLAVTTRPYRNPDCLGYFTL